MPHDAKTLRQVAKLHATCIDQGFLSSLGPRFLTALYRAIDHCDSAVLIVAEDDNGVIGFVTGGCGMKPIYREMLRNWPPLFLALVPVLFQPRKFMGIIAILRRGGGDDSGKDLPQHELFSIAVAPAVRGSGTSGRLYQALCAHFHDQGIPAFRIVVGDTLTPAHRFYTRMGAEPVTTLRLHGASTSTIYVQKIADKGGAGRGL